MYTHAPIFVNVFVSQFLALLLIHVDHFQKGVLTAFTDKFMFILEMRKAAIVLCKGVLAKQRDLIAGIVPSAS